MRRLGAVLGVCLAAGCARDPDREADAGRVAPDASDAGRADARPLDGGATDAVPPDGTADAGLAGPCRPEGYWAIDGSSDHLVLEATYVALARSGAGWQVTPWGLTRGMDTCRDVADELTFDGRFDEATCTLAFELGRSTCVDGEGPCSRTTASVRLDVGAGQARYVSDLGPLCDGPDGVDVPLTARRVAPEALPCPASDDGELDSHRVDVATWQGTEGTYTGAVTVAAIGADEADGTPVDLAIDPPPDWLPDGRVRLKVHARVAHALAPGLSLWLDAELAAEWSPGAAVALRTARDGRLLFAAVQGQEAMLDDAPLSGAGVTVRRGPDACTPRPGECFTEVRRYQATVVTPEGEVRVWGGHPDRLSIAGEPYVVELRAYTLGDGEQSCADNRESWVDVRVRPESP
jgi:hypothetical protein